MKPFNYVRFRAEFRAVCVRRGIDPQRGATSYDRVHITAEERKAAQLRALQARPCWWSDFERWTYAPPYRSSTEATALYHLFMITYGMALTRLWQAQLVRLSEQYSPDAEERARLISRITGLIDRLLDEMGDKLDDAKLSELARALSVLLENRRALAGADDDTLVNLEDVHEKLARLLAGAAAESTADTAESTE